MWGGYDVGCRVRCLIRKESYTVSGSSSKREKRMISLRDVFPQLWEDRGSQFEVLPAIPEKCRLLDVWTNRGKTGGSDAGPMLGVRVGSRPKRSLSYAGVGMQMAGRSDAGVGNYADDRWRGGRMPASGTTPPAGARRRPLRTTTKTESPEKILFGPWRTNAPHVVRR